MNLSRGFQENMKFFKVHKRWWALFSPSLLD
nr:MAG TPA: hypothetical protein [Caudoviricetes sp.]